MTTIFTIIGVLTVSAGLMRIITALDTPRRRQA